jgi:hypothetical protein
MGDLIMFNRRFQLGAVGIIAVSLGAVIGILVAPGGP